MALKKRKSDEKTTKEIMMHTGIVPMKVVLFNPNKEELEKIGVNYDPGEYISDDTFNEGHKQYLASFWMQNREYVVHKNGEKIVIPEGEITVPFMINISDSVATNRSGDKKMYVNKYGDTIYLAEDQEPYEWFDATDLREAHRGEQDLYTFLRAYANLKYSDENCLEDPIKDLFEDDSDFKKFIYSIINDKPVPIVYVLLSLKHSGKNDNGQVKIKEIVYKQYFQKKTQANSAISNFKSWLDASRKSENAKEDAIKMREPKGEFYTVEPAVFTLDEAINKVSDSSENDSDNDDMYKKVDSTF